jgi:23S rRNA (cytosine1962-C5)-methyltransferase
LDQENAPVQIARLIKRRPERARHPWIFAGEVEALPEGISPGEPITVVDHRGRFYATAYCNPRSKIALRVLSWRDEPIDAAFWERRIREAVAARGEFGPTEARRLVNAEGDGLPGLVVDRYAEWTVVQLSTAGTERARIDITNALAQICKPRGIFQRSDMPERALEGLEQRTGVLAGEQPPKTVEITEGPARLLVDLEFGQKTGLFLDQRLNRQAAGPYARGRNVVNCFGYTGGFSVHASLGGAKHVTTIDISKEACELAERNMALNGLSAGTVITANCFDWLRTASDAGERFGLVILDPPAFARTKAALDNAVRGYNELNLRAIKMLEPGGVLVTCSCSRPVSRERFTDIVRRAARDAGRELQLLEDRAQPPDHPVNMEAPESAYLKCLIVRAY